MSNVLTKLVQNGTEYSLPKEIYIIPESVITKGTTKTYGVEPYNTSYYYTDFTIDAAAGVKWEEGKQYLINWDSMTVASSYRNARFRIGTGAYIPLMTSGGAILSGYTYCKKAYTRPYYYSTKYQSGGALHLLEDDNTTYSSMSVAEGQTGTATTARSLTATNLKGIINYHAPEDMIVTQTDYNNLPSDKNSDNRTYFICETISTLMSYEEVIAMRGNTSSQHEETVNVLNEKGTEYFDKFNDEGKLSQDFETYILIGSYQYPYELRCEYWSARGQYRRYVGDVS